MCQGIRDSTWGWRKLLKLRGMAEISEIFFWRWIPNILWHDSWHPDGILYENKKTKLARVIYDAASSMDTKLASLLRDGDWR